MRKLSAKRRRFISEYLLDQNATQAAIRAGYATKTAQVIASRLLKVETIKSAIDTALRQRRKEVEVTASAVIQKYADIAFTDLPDIVDYRNGKVTLRDFDALTPAQKATVKKLKIRTATKIVDGEPTPVDHIEIELHDKLHALDMLGKRLGMFTERHDVTLRNGDREAELRAMFDSMTKDEKIEWLEAQQA